MHFELFLFYLFSSLALASAGLVVAATNPIHSVLFLILLFCNAAGLLLLLEVEFLAMVFIVVYVGAIAVLFLFVVMMLNIQLAEQVESRSRYVPVATLVGALCAFELFLVVEGDLVPKLAGGAQSERISSPSPIPWIQMQNIWTNVEAMGQVLYTHFYLGTILAGIILLIAMLGAIVLTCSVHAMQRGAVQVRRQQIFEQVGRDFSETIVNRQPWEGPWTLGVRPDRTTFPNSL